MKSLVYKKFVEEKGVMIMMYWRTINEYISMIRGRFERGKITYKQYGKYLSLLYAWNQVYESKQVNFEDFWDEEGDEL